MRLIEFRENFLLQIFGAVRRMLKHCIRLFLSYVLRVVPLSLELSNITSWAMIEVTSKCNLRCVYCGKSTSSGEGQRIFSFPEDQILPTIELLKKRGLDLLYMSGIGETTTREGWDRICRTTLSTGVKHTIITNLARPLSDVEAEVLAQFCSVQVSVDTADPDLFPRIRRGAELSTVLANMDRIREAACRIGVRGPELRFDMVVCDKTVHGLVKTVQLGLKYGVTDFYFAGLFKLKDVEGALNVYPVKTLPRSELVTALKALEDAIFLAQEYGCKVQVHEGLLESIKVQLSTALSCPEDDGFPSWDAPSLDKGWTRDCMDPWSMVFLYAQGEVRPCCAYNKGIGSLNDEPLMAILNGYEVLNIRRNLLSGSLDGMMCAHCSMKKPIRIEDFHKTVKAVRLKGILYSCIGRRFTNGLVAWLRDSRF